jgi:hypothetical protein
MTTFKAYISKEGIMSDTTRISSKYLQVIIQRIVKTIVFLARQFDAYDHVFDYSLI